ncbi:hypothetical protein L917_04228 [Phytophthora nicotianae]|uniref:Uncharacterized protein n=1 Tax=Phytophthora nicotianae TaxID=4792 RepID=W2JGP9_PHYNI|nr:hypothetical protein L916_04355 [Phytophthora nicotianae]ETL98759.1 hypothetical protein L917_04228 [Phytophthora nicotianae]
MPATNAVIAPPCTKRDCRLSKTTPKNIKRIVIPAHVVAIPDNATVAWPGAPHISGRNLLSHSATCCRSSAEACTVPRSWSSSHASNSMSTGSSAAHRLLGVERSDREHVASENPCAAWQ